MSFQAVVFGTYSFLDVTASISGPGLQTKLGVGAGASEEGIRIEPIKDINTMNIGAGGEGMHNLSANQAGRLIVTLLKTSPVNAILQTAFNLQTASSGLHGKNVISLVNPVTGDTILARGAAFKKAPALVYAMEGGNNEWEFEAIQVSRSLGAGV